MGKPEDKSQISVVMAPNGAFAITINKDGFGRFISNLGIDELVDIYLAIETTLKAVDLPEG